MIRLLGVAAVTTFLFSTATAANSFPTEALSEDQVFYELMRRVDALFVAQSDSEKLEMLEEMEDSIHYLRDSSGWGDPLPEDYLLSLSYNAYLLSELETAAIEDYSSLLEVVADDLRIKAEHCRLSGAAEPVSTRVKTLDDGAEVGGYKVRYVQKGMENIEACYRSFDTLSSPTEAEKLVPGGYWFWLEKGEYKGERVSKRIGGGGVDTKTIELLVE